MKLIIILALFLTGCSSGGSESPPPKEIYILIGQSNLTQSDHGRSYDYKCDAYGDNGWVKASTPLIQYSSIKRYPKVERVGIADGFAEVICKNGTGLIIHAMGGMDIDEIAPHTEPYRLLLSKLDQIGSYTIKAFIWHQGEGNREDSQYSNKLLHLIESLRADTQDAPFIIGEIYGESVVNEQIRMMPYMTENINVVTAEGLTTHDNVHFTENSALEYGYRYAILAE
jgi:hypothetical protein